MLVWQYAGMAISRVHNILGNMYSIFSYYKTLVIGSYLSCESCDFHDLCFLAVSGSIASYIAIAIV